MVYRPAINPQLCFVALPLKKPFVDYCEGIIKLAAADAGLRALTSSDIYGTGPIIQDIWLQIWAAAVVIADVTEKNPNVNYELGLCHAIGVPTVIISQRIEDVPFDYRHRRCILYNTADVDWQQRLRKQISETLKSLTVAPPKDELAWPYDTSVLRTAKRVGAFISSEDAIVDVLRGTRLVCDSVARSYGPHGIWISIRTNMGERQFKNGRSIAENTWSQNRLEMAGINATVTFLARPSWLKLIYSSEAGESRETRVPPVKIAISWRMSRRRSAKPALTTAFRQARTILQTGAWGEAEDLNVAGGELSS